MTVMNLLKSWLCLERGRAARLAQHLQVPSSFVTKMGTGEKHIPVIHAADIEKFTGGAVTRQQMFPDDWQRIWPEIADTASSVPAHPATPAAPAAQAAQQGVACADSLTLPQSI